jgi:glycogen debranching enzyme
MASIENDFRKQYGEHGIYAGASHFRDYWARDSLFACLGALAIGDTAQVRATVQHFLDTLRSDGHVPLRIGARSEVARYFGLPTRTGAVHAQDKGQNDSYDSNTLLLIVADEYERATGDRFDRERILQVIAWLDAHDHNALLLQGPYSDWEDSISVTGARLYTNVCYARALDAAARLTRNKTYAARAKKTRAAIQNWWNKDHFTDGTKRDASVVMTAGNLLAIVWGVATKQQSKQILARIAQRETVCPPGGWFAPSTREVYTPFFLIGLADYHGAMEWSWLAGLEIWALRVAGMNKEAAQRTRAFEKLARAYGGVHEVYDSDKPVRRWFYKSETNFAWALGVFLKATRS